MNVWFAKIAVLCSLLIYIFIRWPHGNRLGTLPVVNHRRGRLEIALLTFAAIGTTLVPVLWLITPLFNFAEYGLHPVPYALGVLVMIVGLWLFHRSHVDLGLYWSPTLQVRENHQLIQHGIFSNIRHPMYAAMLLLGVAHVLFLPNWFAGPAYLVSFGTLYLFRVRVEESMMLDQFGDEYEQYMDQTGRLFPKWRS